MTDNCWQITPENGFLIYPDPLHDLGAVDSGLSEAIVEHLETIASDLPDLIADGYIREVLDNLPTYDFSGINRDDPRIIERLHMLYTYFASAYIHMGGTPTQYLGASVAVPVVYLSAQLSRLPMLTYAGMVLNNWKRLDSAQALTLNNLDVLQTFTDLYDERWFFLVHISIEAQAGQLLDSLRQALIAVKHDNTQTVLACLRDIRSGLVEVIKIFHRMPDYCDPDIYYQQVRQPLFGLKDVIFEGVPQFKDQPQTFMGGSGAQSTIIPAILAALGVQHQQSHLTHYLTAIRSYMPQEHQNFVDDLTTNDLRDYCKRYLHLQDAYNHCLQQVMTFRRAHFYYARTYIFEKSTESVGTGGTAFMEFLNVLIRETEAHLL
jgi:indoleamine 2,3-dioxygenase